MVGEAQQGESSNPFALQIFCSSIQLSGPSGCEHFISVNISNPIDLFYQGTALNVDGCLSYEFIWINALRGLASLLYFSLQEYYNGKRYDLTKATKDNSPHVYAYGSRVCCTPIVYPHDVRTTINELMESIAACQTFLYKLFGREKNWKGNTFFFQCKGNPKKSDYVYFKGTMWLAPFVEGSLQYK